MNKELMFDIIVQDILARKNGQVVTAYVKDTESELCVLGVYGRLSFRPRNKYKYQIRSKDSGRLMLSLNLQDVLSPGYMNIFYLKNSCNHSRPRGRTFV